MYGSCTTRIPQSSTYPTPKKTILKWNHIDFSTYIYICIHTYIYIYIIYIQYKQSITMLNQFDTEATNWGTGAIGIWAFSVFMTTKTPITSLKKRWKCGIISTCLGLSVNPNIPLSTSWRQRRHRLIHIENAPLLKVSRWRYAGPVVLDRLIQIPLRDHVIEEHCTSQLVFLHSALTPVKNSCKY